MSGGEDHMDEKEMEMDAVNADAATADVNAAVADEHT